MEISHQDQQGMLVHHERDVFACGRGLNLELGRRWVVRRACALMPISAPRTPPMVKVRRRHHHSDSASTPDTHVVQVNHRAMLDMQ